MKKLLRWNANQFKMAQGLITDGNHGWAGYCDGTDDDGLSNTVNPHYWSTELSLPDSMVKGFLSTLRKREVLQLSPHPDGGVCIDPDTHALELRRGPKWDAFVIEYNCQVLVQG